MGRDVRPPSRSGFRHTAMKRLHLWIGAITLFIFLLTGQYMDYLEVRTNALGETARVMFRSRHIYLLLAGLVNVGLGAYFDYRERVQQSSNCKDDDGRQSEVSLQSRLTRLREERRQHQDRRNDDERRAEQLQTPPPTALAVDEVSPDA